MSLPDFENAKHYALHQLRTRLSADLTYHSLFHTENDVIPAAARIAVQENIEGEDLLLLYTAAWYHDIGFTRHRENHEEVGGQISREVLPRFGYNPDQIEKIVGIIMATKLPQNPKTKLEEIIADSDLDSLGREDFLLRSHALRMEMASFGKVVSDIEWYTNQLQFLKEHSYFTTASKLYRNAGKIKNIKWVSDLISEYKANEDQMKYSHG